MNAIWRRLRPLLSTFVRYMHISYLEARSEHEGTVLGVLWIPVSTLVSAALLALVFRNPGTHGPIEFFLYVLCGYACWNFISASISGSVNVIQTKFDFAVHSGLSLVGLFAKILADRIFEYGLNLALLTGAVLILSPGNLGWHTLLFVPFLASLAVTSLAISYVANLLTIYFPDLASIIKTGVRLMFFATPVFWRAENGDGVRHVLERYNPASYYLHFARQVFGIEYLDESVWVVASALTLVACLIGYAAYARSASYVRNLK